MDIIIYWKRTFKVFLYFFPIIHFVLQSQVFQLKSFHSCFAWATCDVATYKLFILIIANYKWQQKNIGQHSLHSVHFINDNKTFSGQQLFRISVSFLLTYTILPKERNNSKWIINLTKMTTLLSLKTDMFQQLQLPSSEWYKTKSE